MKNPGLTAAYIHPRMENIPRGDPDFDPEEEEGEGSDWVPFSGWRREPGQPLRAVVGPAFKPGETPEDVIHGEIIKPEEQDAADHIINGDHDSDMPSDNPHVEYARQDLHTDAANDTVHTLSDLLSGNRPEDVGGLDEAHDYLKSRDFTGVKVNPQHGMLFASSPTGTQLMRRNQNLPAVLEKSKKPTYTLTNKHGTFESHDPHRLVRAMVAFQLVQNQIMMQEQRRERDKDKQLSTTSGIMRDMTHGFYDWLDNRFNKPKPSYVPSNHAIFEPGAGVEWGPKGPKGGVYGGWVAPSHLAPDHWREDPHPDINVSYSPGHFMNHFIDPVLSSTPHGDREVEGHTFTYAQSPKTNHIVPIRSGRFTKWVQPIHPQARDLFRKNVPNPPTEPEPAATMPKRGPTPPPHSPPLSVGHEDEPAFRFPEDEEGWTPPPPHRLSAVQMNDLCPVCASGYLEPYDQDFHECLNCGSLVKHVGFDKQAAARPKGGLGRGLKNIEPPEATKSQSIMDIAHGGTQDPNKADEPLPTAEYHPLRGEEMPEEYQEYQPPKRIVGSSDPEPITLDEHLGKFGFQPHHRPGGERVYAAPMPGTRNMFLRLTEGVPHPQTGETGWVLSADTFPAKPAYTQGGKPYRSRGVPLERTTKDPVTPGKKFNQPLTDPMNLMAGERTRLASGSHPVHDIDFARAIADAAINGRDSETYWNAINHPHTAPPAPMYDPFLDQRGNRHLSSVRNPGLARLESTSRLS